MRRRPLFVLTYLAPAVILYFGFVGWPLIQAFGLSTFKWSGLSDQKTFIGLGNYSRLVNDGVFRQSVSHNLWLLVVGGIAIFALAIALAHALQQKGRLAATMRSLFLFPHVMSLVAVAIMWRFVFDPTPGGLLNGILGQQHDWLGQKASALPSVLSAFVWYSVGFYVMLFLAGIKQIDGEVQEASQLDGAEGWTKFRLVTWPLMLSVRRVGVIYLTVNVLNIFALVWVMTSGGPDRATETILTYLYQVGIAQSKFGYASAIAVANFLLVMILAGVLGVLHRRKHA